MKPSAARFQRTSNRGRVSFVTAVNAEVAPFARSDKSRDAEILPSGLIERMVLVADLGFYSIHLGDFSVHVQIAFFETRPQRDACRD